MLHRLRLVFRTLVSAVRVLVRRCWRKTKGGSGSSAALLPTYAQSPGSKSAASSGGHGLTGFSVRELKMMFKHFMSDKTSLRIFTFLCINFLFMFVELIYGFYSNSLGLISDAGHMLFDCVCEGTPITMADGNSRPIEDVQAGDSVLALDSNDALVPRKVHHLLRKGIRSCVELMLEDGRTLTVTADHKIRTMGGTWSAAKDLVVGETRVACGIASGLPLFFATVVGRRAVGDRAVYDLVVPSGIKGKDLDSFIANGTLVHNCTALGIGLYASFVSKLKPNHRYTYGYARYEILSGYVNAVFLLFIGYFIFVESVERLFRPPEITSDSLVLVSVLGLMVNMVGLFFFHDHGSHGHSHAGPGGGHGHAPVAAAPAASSAHQDAPGGDHGHSHGGTACGGHGGGGNAKANQAAEAQKNSNMLAIYLHIMADALGSVGVIISSLLVQYKGWTSADAICSIIISVLIVASVMPLIWSTLDVLNQRTPIFKEAMIRDTLAAMTAPGGEFEALGVVSYREPHFWAFSDSETIGTMHVQVREDADEQRLLGRLVDLWKDSGVGVSNLSIQLEKEKYLATVESDIKARPRLTGGRL